MQAHGPTRPDQRHLSGRVTAVLAVLTVGWLTVCGSPAAFVIYGIGQQLRDEPTTAADKYRDGIYFIVFAVLVVGLPALASAIAYHDRRIRASAWLIGAALLLVPPAAYIGDLGVRSVRDAYPPPPEHPYVGCQAHSGGSNTCPGG